MPIPHRVERVVGVFILLPLIALSTLVLISGTSKGWFEKKVDLDATFDQGMSLRTGASVVMEGVRIGWVDSLEFDQENKVQVSMKIRKRFAGQIRTDSVATITKLNILGEPVVVISRGSREKPAVENGVEIQTQATREVQPQELRQLFLDTIDLVAKLNSDRSTVGKVIRDDGGLYEGLVKLLASGNRLLDHAPPVPVVLTPESALTMTLNARLQAQVDGLVGMAQRLDKMLARLEEGRGTVGKLLSDEELYTQVMGLLKESRQMVSDLRVTAEFLKQAAPGIPNLVESGDALIRRADGLLQKLDANPLLGGGPPKPEKKAPTEIEERFKHYRTETPAEKK